jgi:peptide/nickel transport system substrate-binding protein
MTNTDNQVLIDRLADAARDGKISRRSFMNYSMAAGMTASPWWHIPPWRARW